MKRIMYMSRDMKNNMKGKFISASDRNNDQTVMGEMNVRIESENECSNQNDLGHIKCDVLREIRKRIAEINNIEFHSDECQHKGACEGFCPACDLELRYLEDELKKKRERGKKVNLSGLDLDEIFISGCDLSYDVLDDETLRKQLLN